MPAPKPDQLIDATGLRCPMPVLRAQKALRSMAEGEVLEVHSTDPASKTDMPAFCSEAGHDLVSMTEDDGLLVYLIRKGS
jgi:tRNA 2-thiouridine synthesizing protein A